MDEAKRIFGVPDFRYYALADGVSTILGRIGKGPLGAKKTGRKRTAKWSYSIHEKWGKSCLDKTG